MLLGIPFHTALAFAGTQWLVTSPQLAPTVEAFGEFLHVWRMPAFYAVAGFFAALILRRQGSGRWVKGRFKRLGIPLLFGMIVFSPLQWLLVGWGRSDAGVGASTFALSKLWPPSEWWTMHLWFLVELLIYCCVLAAVYASPLRGRAAHLLAALSAWVQRRPALGSAVLLVGASVSVVVSLAAWQVANGDELLLGLITRNVLVFAPAFVLGVALGADPANLRAFLSAPYGVTLPVGLASTAIVIVLDVVLQADSAAALALQSVCWTIGGLTLASAAFRLSTRVFNKPRASVRWLVDASLVVYIVHQPLIVLYSILVQQAGVYSWAGWAVTVALTAVSALVFYELVNTNLVTRTAFTGDHRRGMSFLNLVAPKRRATARVPG